MKTIIKQTLLLAMLVMPWVTFPSVVSPSASDDTIPADIRYKNYYYSKWIDECPAFLPNGGVVDSTYCRFFQKINRYPDFSVAKAEHTNQRIKVKGIVAMLDRYTSPNIANVGSKLPEYLYIYQYLGRHYAVLDSIVHPEFKDGLDLVLLDSARWDTATARVMEYKRGWNGEFTQYIYLYEAYFEQPVYVDSIFYIFGSTNSNVYTAPGSYNWQYIPTEYVDLIYWGAHCRINDEGKVEYYSIADGDDCDAGDSAGRDWVAIRDISMPEWGWYTPWPDSPCGYYLPIVDQWDLNAVPNDTAYGSVLGAGRWPDDTYDTIEAVPTPGYHFDSWNDGSTENPRVIHLTSDTSFVAIFYANETFTLSVTSADVTKGSVTGGGTYYGETDNTIAAFPNNDTKFLYWNDGDTGSQRVIHLTSDTAFVAYFADKEFYNVQTATNNDEWGSVEGGGVYMEGEDATLSVTTAPFCLFEGWSDGVWQLPRTVTVTQDTLFTALLSFDSVWAAGVNMAGGLQFSVSPNPTNGLLNITVEQQGPCRALLFDMQGRTAIRKESNDATFSLDITTLPAGRYLLMVSNEGLYGIKTVVKK